MTTHILNFGYTTGQSLTAQLFEIDSDTVVATAASVTEATNRKGRYAATFSDVDAGDYLMVYFIDGSAAGSEFFTLAGTDGESVLPWSERYAQVDLRKVNGDDATPATDVATLTKQVEILAGIAGIDVGGGVLVLPAVGVVGDRTLGMSLNPKVGETVVASVTLYWQDGVTPYSLAGRTVCVVFEDRHGEDVAVVPSGDLMVHGESENVVSFAYPDEVTSEERVLRAAIVEEAAPKAVHIEGLCNVTRAPMVDQ